MREDGNMTPQRRVIRVSEMFAEHRSSGDARHERSEVVGVPVLLRRLLAGKAHWAVSLSLATLAGAVCKADWG